ncbi:MAG TPA: 3-isopropylmalate dehydratase large subunit [Thermoplasmata archaeon]|nr:3-isopropylmalate dehydratase large subunit [Thermoplasmata archaeon]
MGKTIAEKVLGAHSGSDCSAGDITVASVDFCMAQDGTSTMMMRELEALGFETPGTRRGMALVIDHSSPSPSANVSRIHERIRSFARSKGIRLHDIGEGVCHQVIPESGKVLPGDLVVGADSHTCTYGALNACSTGLGSADVAAATFTGKLWFRVPESHRIELRGAFSPFVSAKDLILDVIGKVGADGATYKSIEYVGDGLRSLSMDGRMTVANMAVEMGAKFCPFPCDQMTCDWFSSRGLVSGPGVASDPDAEYEKSMAFDLSDIVPKVAVSHKVDNVRDVSDLRGTKVHQVFVGTCTNGRLSDLESVAKVMRGRRVKEGVRMIVAPASKEVLLEAMDAGLIRGLLRSGAVVMPPGCGPCVGTHAGIPADGENVVSTANRNFRGRMGNNMDVNIFLVSPETAAASAVMGEITDPREV